MSDEVAGAGLVQTAPRTKVLKNGAVYDLDAGRIVANPGGGTSAITQATASDMHALRAEKYQRAAVKGLSRVPGADKRAVGTPLAAWSYIVGKQAELATMIDKGRSSTEAARFVGGAIGIMGLGGSAGANSGGDNVNISVPGAFLRGLLDDLRRARAENDQNESG